MLFRVLFAFDVLGLLGLLYFFVDGLQYYPDGDYVATWAPLLGVPIAVMAGALVLRGKGRTRWANGLLGLLALPFLFFAAFAGLFIVIAPDMK